MSTLIKAKINRDKINSKLLFAGKKGTYLDIDIWINDKADQYGNNVSIEQSVEKGEKKIYIGEGKVKWTNKRDEDIHVTEAEVIPNDDEPAF